MEENNKILKKIEETSYRFLHLIQTFDPLSENYVAEQPPVRSNIPEWIANAIPNNVVEQNGRQIIKWHYLSGLNERLVPRIMEKSEMWFKTDLESITRITMCCEISLMVKLFLGCKGE